MNADRRTDTPDAPEVYAYLCIGCPLGCRVELDEAQGEVLEVRGNSCKKGEEFARQEHIDPRRMVTTTVTVTGALWPRLPVKTSGAVPKAMVADVCRTLRQVRVHAPVTLGDVVMSDVLGTGIDVVATRDMERVGVLPPGQARRGARVS
jgi:CxxC motif-containing protein